MCPLSGTMPMEVIAPVAEVKLGTFIHVALVRLVHLVDPETFTVFVDLGNDELIHPCFAAIKKSFGRDFPVLERMEFTGRGKKLRSRELSNIVFDLKFNKFVLGCGDVYGIVCFYGHEQYLPGALQTLFGENQLLRERFDQIVLRLKRLVVPSPLSGLLPPSVRREKK